MLRNKTAEQGGAAPWSYRNLPADWEVHGRELQGGRRVAESSQRKPERQRQGQSMPGVLHQEAESGAPAEESGPTPSTST